jgi:sterol desaturase/sphingolipid hydroxylase (fatty acid hydroxylase superfamily)
MSFLPYQVAVWLGISAYHAGVLATRWFTEDVHPLQVVAECLAGATVSRGIWVVSEYAVHRYLLHGPLYPIQHKYHHESPVDDKYMFVTPLITLPANALYYYGVRLVAGETVTTMLWVFMPLHYLAFEWLHWLSHQPISDQTSLIYMVKQYHREHHKNPYVNYGITTPTGDFLCNTLA